MKIILLKDVPRVGNRGQIIDVADSYGMNAFVNRGLAKIATASDVKQLEQKEKIKKENKEKELDKSIEIFKRLEAAPFVFKRKVDDKGNLYARVTAKDIVNYIFEKEKISINEKQVKMDDVLVIGDFKCVVEVNNKKYNLVVKVEK